MDTAAVVCRCRCPLTYRTSSLGGFVIVIVIVVVIVTDRQQDVDDCVLLMSHVTPYVTYDVVTRQYTAPVLLADCVSTGYGLKK